jgi:hypothetical protein
VAETQHTVGMGTGNGSITSMASINHGTPATNYPKDLWTALKQNMGSDELTRLDILLLYRLIVLYL